MKHKRIAGLVVAFGVLAGSAFGFNALAAGPRTDTQQDQEWSGGRGFQRMMDIGGEGSSSFQDRISNRFGGMMNSWRSSDDSQGFFGGMHGGRGVRGTGYFGQDLTEEEREQLETIRDEMQTTLRGYQDRIQEAAANFRDALETKNKETILSAWNSLKSVQEEVKTAAEPYRAQMVELLGEDFEYMFRHMDDSRINDIIADLEAADADESQEIMEDLNSGAGFGPMYGIGGTGRGGIGGRACHGNRR